MWGENMDISTLCDRIDLQPEISSRVLAFSDNYEFTSADKYLKAFRDYSKMTEARKALQALLGEDSDNIKILACMLKASADVYEIYKEKGIGDDIYFATMRCYTRFIDETYKMTGRLYFDRYWWTSRQAGCHLFRLGELEYEMKPIDGEKTIEIHIPSDADLSPSAVNSSLESAKRFFAAHYPELSNAEYRCHSWLMDRQLRKMLGDGSNIRRFQDRFDIYDEGEADTEFIEWLYNTRSTDYSALPENTSLQRNVKKHLLSGGVIRNSYGRLKK